MSLLGTIRVMEREDEVANSSRLDRDRICFENYMVWPIKSMFSFRRSGRCVAADHHGDVILPAQPNSLVD